MAAVAMSRLRNGSNYSGLVGTFVPKTHSFCRDRMDNGASTRRSLVVTTRQLSHTRATLPKVGGILEYLRNGNGCRQMRLAG
jgi:hypothetical protein